MCWKQASVVIDSNRSRTGEGLADHDGMFCDATVDRDCGRLRCRDTSRIVALLSQQPCSDRGGGNSKIIIAVRAENEIKGSDLKVPVGRSRKAPLDSTLWGQADRLAASPRFKL
jgi:hypothetical protein